jgi:enoyl-[acyl-carrier-protein] reductase (NADH)
MTALDLLAIGAAAFALAELVTIGRRLNTMSEATARLDASVARIAKDVGEVVARIRSNTSAGDSASVLADCDSLDALSATLEGLGQPSDAGDEPQDPASQERPTA